MLPGAAAASPATSIEPLVLMLTGTAPEPPAAPPDLTGLALSVARTRKDYQACRYAELVSRLPPPAQPARYGLSQPHRR
jgi:hypothetical protein